MTHFTFPITIGMTCMTFMTYSEKQYKQKISLGQSGNALMMLIAICLIMFVGLAFMKAVWYFRYPKEVAELVYYAGRFSWFAEPAMDHHHPHVCS
jgi:predicted membrane protein